MPHRRKVTHAVQSYGSTCQASVRRVGFFQSTLGKKVVVAVTGAIWIGFLVGHVAGNLKVFLPDPEPGVRDIDVYAAFLRSAGEPILPHAPPPPTEAPPLGAPIAAQSLPHRAPDLLGVRILQR